MLVQGILAPFKAGAKALTSQAEQFYGYIFNYESLSAENEALKEKIANMEDEARRADAVERENQRLRDLLNLKSTHEDYDLVDAYIIGWSSTDWTNTMTINRGTDAGVEQGMCAITANGQVVGLVVEAGPNYAVVKTVLDSTLEISCVIASSGYNGMSKGGYFYKDINHLKLDYLPSSAVIRNKDQVVTSGSTVYPRGLIVGYVVDAGFDDTGVAKFAVLEPAADIASLEQIFILTNYTTE
jgi:rod shape-determining protein MreC